MFIFSIYSSADVNNQVFTIQFDSSNNIWSINAKKLAKLLLPQSLSYTIISKNGEKNWHINFNDVTTEDLDYSWIFLAKIINREISNV